MKKKFSIATSLLVLLAGVAGCGNNNSTSNVSSSSVNNSSTSESTSVVTSTNVSSSVISSTTNSTSSSSVDVVVPTDALTDEMLEGLNGGYSAKVYRTTNYEGGSSSRTIAEISVNDKNYAFKRFSTDDGVTKKTLVEDSHYQINPEEDFEMLYNAGLSIGNTVIYTPVMGRDPFIFDEIHLSWEEGAFSNAFATLKASNFTRVGEENKFALNLLDPALEYDNVFNKMDKQLFGDNVESDVESFYLLTNGNKITGFELTYEAYASYESMVYKSVNGNFTGFGADVTSFVKPLEGRNTDAEFDAAMASLRNYNYEVNHTQGGYDYTTNQFVGRGRFEGQCDGNTLNYYYYNNSNKKMMNYAYYNVQYEGQTYLQGAVNINDTYYSDVLYSGSLMDLLPSFNVSSELFIKSSESTDDVLVYDLDKSIVISVDNDNATYSSFDSDGWNDRTVYLTITIDKTNGTINFHNETTDLVDSGLVEDVLYSNIGKVNTLITDNVSDNCDDLSWADLFSNDEISYQALTKKIPVALLDNLPTFGGRYSYVHFDASASALFVDTYEKEENENLITTYGQKLLDAGYIANEVEEGEAPSYSCVFANGSRSYKLKLALGTYWNSDQEWGQFQVFVSVSAA